MSGTTIVRNETTEGETIEQKMYRIIHNREPLTDGAPLIYTDYKEGINPMYDIRTDKMEEALHAKDKTVRNDIAKRKEYMEGLKKAENGEKGEKNSQSEVNSGTTD